jgi:hypothetical protein
MSLCGKTFILIKLVTRGKDKARPEQPDGLARWSFRLVIARSEATKQSSSVAQI